MCIRDRVGLDAGGGAGVGPGDGEGGDEGVIHRLHRFPKKIFYRRKQRKRNDAATATGRRDIHESEAASSGGPGLKLRVQDIHLERVGFGPEVFDVDLHIGMKAAMDGAGFGGAAELKLGIVVRGEGETVDDDEFFDAARRGGSHLLSLIHI